MTRKVTVHDDGKKKNCYYKYICRLRRDDIESCPAKGIQEGALLEMLWELLKRQTSLAGELSAKADDIRSSVGWAAENASLEQEHGNAVKKLGRLRMLHDSLYPMYADEKALTEQEYMQMKQDYRIRIGQAEKELEAIEEKKRDRARQMEGNQWLEAFMSYQDETEVTEEMAHALISRIEVHADRRISVSFQWQDEFQKLVEPGDKCLLYNHRFIGIP